MRGGIKNPRTAERTAMRGVTMGGHNENKIIIAYWAVFSKGVLGWFRIN